MDTFLLGFDEFEDLRQKVIVDGQLLHISEFVDDEKRPITLCPICKERVSLKLGSERIHHYAHRPDSTCPMSTGETLIHFNSKMHIAHQLRTADEILISRKCTSCSEEVETIWVLNFDEVRVEYPIGSLRADIAVLYQGEVIAVIEIWVSHAIGFEKVAIYRDKNISHIQLIGAPRIYRDPFPWDPKQPLLVQQIGPDVEDWTCKACLENIHKRLSYNSKSENMRGQERLKNGFERHAKALIDYFYPEGKYFQVRVDVKKEFINGRCVAMEIITFRHEFSVRVEGEAAQSKITKCFDQHLSDLKTKNMLIDNLTMWVEGQKVFDMKGLRKPKYKWSKSEMKWIIRPQ